MLLRRLFSEHLVQLSSSSSSVSSRVLRHSLRISSSGRGLRTKSRDHLYKLKSHKSQTFTASEHRSWMLRLSHENSYLSWSRNAAICAGVGATIMIVEMQHSLPMADYYAVGHFYKQDIFTCPKYRYLLKRGHFTLLRTVCLKLEWFHYTYLKPIN